MSGNELKITVLPDGRIKVETDAISPALHTTADALLRELFRLAGGSVEHKHKSGGVHTHGDAHEHSHEHGHAGHSH